ACFIIGIFWNIGIFVFFFWIQLIGGEVKGGDIPKYLDLRGFKKILIPRSAILIFHNIPELLF
ncbi:hypothetical protein WDU94_001704, partial [Cyamophila willieti]